VPQLRQNIITGEWVVIAPERAKRPNDFIIVDTVKSPVNAICPFEVEGEEYKKHNLKQFETKEIYVIPNKFPAFLEDPKLVSTRTYRIEREFYSARPSLGGNDVVVVKEHGLNLYTFTPKIWTELTQVTKKRYQYWRRDRKVEYTMGIYNEGTRAGASIVHPHAQIFASNIIPNQVHREVVGSQTYFENNGACVFCDLIAHEKREKIRLIWESKNFIAFTFYAARFPFEIWIFPKAHAAHLEDESDRTMAELGEALRHVFEKLGKILHNPPVNYYIHDLSNSIAHSDFYHWHIEITPRVSIYGGFELGSGVVIDVIAPEDAAMFLRNEEVRKERQ
jgi:UDPglucose--hexose-1-phosphate uridylyltransferase